MQTKKEEKDEKYKEKSSRFLMKQHKEFLHKIKGCTVFQISTSTEEKPKAIAAFSLDGKKLDVFNKPKMIFSHCLASGYGIYKTEDKTHTFHIGVFLQEDVTIIYTAESETDVFGGERWNVFLEKKRSYLEYTETIMNTI